MYGLYFIFCIIILAFKYTYLKRQSTNNPFAIIFAMCHHFTFDMNKSACLCIVYVSEALHSPTVEKLTEFLGVKLLHSFRDETYNRTSFYFADRLETEELVVTAVDFCKLAFSL